MQEGDTFPSSPLSPLPQFPFPQFLAGTASSTRSKKRQSITATAGTLGGRHLEECRRTHFGAEARLEYHVSRGIISQGGGIGMVAYGGTDHFVPSRLAAQASAAGRGCLGKRVRLPQLQMLECTSNSTNWPGPSPAYSEPPVLLSRRQISGSLLLQE